jgi:predicted ABC-type ATPase
MKRHAYTEHQPVCIVIAGPNGAGKTTFAREFLPKEAGVVNFVNADLIAAGLSPLDPSLARLIAGRLVLTELDRLARSRVSFAFETTMSGRTYLASLKRWKSVGYRIEIVFLRLNSPAVALRRIAARVRQGGHAVPRADVIRRIARGRALFPVYCAIADAWAVYDNTGRKPVLLEKSP